MKKFTIQDVKNYLEEHDKNHECELLSTEYIDCKSDLEFRCNKCGRIFERNFSSVKRNEHFFCAPCSQGRNLDINNIKEFIAKYDINNDCELISTQYQNWHTPLKFKCNRCGKEFERTTSQLKERIFPCPQCCRKAVKRTKFDINSVKDFIQRNDINNDCELLSTIYINNTTPLLFKCNECGKEFERTFATMKAKKAFKCYRCSHHIDPNYDSTIYENLLRYFRGKTYLWKKDFLLTHNQCDITGEQNCELDIHHLINFQTILNQASENTEIPLIYKIEDYKLYGYDVNLLINEFLRLHSEVPAVLLKKEIHQKFHKIYGYKNNTPEQYYCFKENYYKEDEKND